MPYTYRQPPPPHQRANTTLAEVSPGGANQYNQDLAATLTLAPALPRLVRKGLSGVLRALPLMVPVPPLRLLLGGQTVDAGPAVITEGAGQIAGTAIAGYDGAEVMVVLLGDATRPERKVAPEGAVTLLASPTVSNPLTAASDNTVTFSQQARQVWVRNFTATDVYVEADAAASTTSWPVLAGESVYLGMFTTVLHVYPTGSGVQVNQAGGLYIRAGM